DLSSSTTRRSSDLVIGVVADVGLNHAQVELTRLDRVDVEHRTAGRFNGAADAVVLAVFVHQTADGAAGCVIDAGHAARTDTDEFLLCSSRQRRHQGGEHGCGAGTDCQVAAKSDLELFLHTNSLGFTRVLLSGG